MTFLHSILACLCTIVTFTIETKSSVSVSGITPEHSSAEYACTYKKGQLTAGNTATLSLTGWQGLEIHSITLWMRSNKTSGAGTLQMTADGHTCWDITDATFDNGGWRQARQNHDDTGGFCTEYVPVSHTFTPSIHLLDGEICIAVTASQSSLYIEKYEIEYTHAPKRAYTVTFSSTVGDTPTAITEEATAAGIILPSIKWAQGDWQFAGWSEREIADQTSIPTLFANGSRYYPSFDCTLYAVFTNASGMQTRPTSALQLQDKSYVICLQVPAMMLHGAIEQKRIATSAAQIAQSPEGSWLLQSSYTDEHIYQLSMVTDSTGYIYHSASMQPIGYQDGNLSSTSALWTFRKHNDGFIILCNEAEQKSFLTAKMVQTTIDNNETIDQICLILYPEVKSSFLFFEVPDGVDEPIYSCHPLRYIEAVHAPMTTPLTRKTIRNGQLILEVNGMIMDILGHKMR